MFCDIVIPRTPLNELTYELPRDMEVAPGDCVRVPLRGKQVTAVVFGLRKELPECQVPGKLQQITKILARGMISSELLCLVRWVADYYVASMGEVLSFVLPRGVFPQKRTAPYPQSSTGVASICSDGGADAEAVARQNFSVLVCSESKEKEAVADFLKRAQRYGSVVFLMPERRLKEWRNLVRDIWGDGVIEYHNKLSPANQRKAWLKAVEAEQVVVVGVRGAVWAPVKKLAGVVILEEHFSGYKEERRPGWHARDVAIARAKFAACPVLLTDRTPTLETIANIKSGRFTLLAPLELPINRERIFVVDMRLHRGELLSPLLLTELKRADEKNRVALLFLNRKGVSRFVVCRQCGNVLRCSRCGVPGVLTADSRLTCRYCGTDCPAPDRCPSCQGVDFEYRAPGVDMVQRKLKEYGFSGAGTKIVVGTRKLLSQDFPENLGVVGIVNLDTEFALPDFRARERVWQLLCDVINRVQRQRARLVIQTYCPEESVLDCCLRGDSAQFFKEELRLRKEAGFPPYRRLVLLTIKGADRELVGKQSEQLRRIIEEQGKKIQPRLEILGPVTTMKAGRFNARLLVKVPTTIMPGKVIPRIKLQNSQLRIEVDPQEIV
ncbi:MAG: hypothetical protein K6T77_02435 [candidate division WOR-3 bacterium]|nr:hypothetical protein [candidate division WOR-3 bacterium]